MPIYLRESELNEAFNQAVEKLNLKDTKEFNADDLTNAISENYKALTEYDAINNDVPNFAKVMRAIVKTLQLFMSKNTSKSIPDWLGYIHTGIHNMQFIETKMVGYKPSPFGEVLPLIDDNKITENDFAVAIYGWSQESIRIRYREVKAASLNFVERTLTDLKTIDAGNLPSKTKRLTL